jgi:hypothetical protein
MAFFYILNLSAKKREGHKKAKRSKSDQAVSGFSLRVPSRASRINSFEQYQQKKALRPFCVTV